MPAALPGRAHAIPVYLPASWAFASSPAEDAAVQSAGQHVMRLKPFSSIRKPQLLAASNGRISALYVRSSVMLSAQQGRMNAQQEHEYCNDGIKYAATCPDEASHITFDFLENFASAYHASQSCPVYFQSSLPNEWFRHRKRGEEGACTLPLP